MSSELHPNAPHVDNIYPSYPPFPTEAQAVDPSVHAADEIPHLDNVRGETSFHDGVVGSGQRYSYFGDSATPQRNGSAQDLPEPGTAAFLPYNPPIARNLAPSGQFDMLPPPASIHPSWLALHHFAQTHASTHGYALSINTTAKNRSRIKLACVCYGAPKNTHKLTPETRVRKNRVSYKTGCRMWVEGKRQDDGSWLLRVGEPQHNHPGRPPDKWALQRKRTWGMPGGRVGVGGVTAKEEKQRLSMTGDDNALDEVENPADTPPDHAQGNDHSMERGSLVWKIVEQEMAYAGGRGQGRDRGVGRTVKILEERLPGIHILKRDVYNIRAQIKRARKAAEQSTRGDMAESESELSATPEPVATDEAQQRVLEIDSTLAMQCNDALEKVTSEKDETERLKEEVTELRQELMQRTRELEERDAQIRDLQAQLARANAVIHDEADRA